MWVLHETQSFSQGVVENIPVKTPKKTKPVRKGFVYFVRNNDNKILMERRPDKGLLGGLLAADYGSGRHIHCALNLFYQMDNLVPGAFRIFVNILKK